MNFLETIYAIRDPSRYNSLFRDRANLSHTDPGGDSKPAGLLGSHRIPDMHTRRTTPAQAASNIASGVHDDEAVIDLVVDRVIEDMERREEGGER